KAIPDVGKRGQKTGHGRGCRVCAVYTRRQAPNDNIMTGNISKYVLALSARGRGGTVVLVKDCLCGCQLQRQGAYPCQCVIGGVYTLWPCHREASAALVHEGGRTMTGVNLLEVVRGRGEMGEGL